MLPAGGRPQSIVNSPTPRVCADGPPGQRSREPEPLGPRRHGQQPRPRPGRRGRPGGGRPDGELEQRSAPRFKRSRRRGRSAGGARLRRAGRGAADMQSGRRAADRGPWTWAWASGTLRGKSGRGRCRSPKSNRAASGAGPAAGLSTTRRRGGAGRTAWSLPRAPARTAGVRDPGLQGLFAARPPVDDDAPPPQRFIIQRPAGPPWARRNGTIT